ncbi:hypothetical protein EDB85DRAFT_1885510 [Lactarius pseudohatsudake]|nr:hypothetical protein EDB85DRAFT_1885510 [Lactarius pseudohatsudake]
MRIGLLYCVGGWGDVAEVGGAVRAHACWHQILCAAGQGGGGVAQWCGNVEVAIVGPGPELWEWHGSGGGVLSTGDDATAGWHGGAQWGLAHCVEGATVGLCSGVAVMSGLQLWGGSHTVSCNSSRSAKKKKKKEKRKKEKLNWSVTREQQYDTVVLQQVQGGAERRKKKLNRDDRACKPQQQQHSHENAASDKLGFIPASSVALQSLTPQALQAPPLASPLPPPSPFTMLYRAESVGEKKAESGAFAMTRAGAITNGRRWE